MAAPKEVSVIVRATDAVTGPLREMKSGFESFAGVIRGIGATIVGSAIGTFLKDSVVEGLKAEDSYRRLGVSVRNAGGDFASMKPQIDTVVDGVQRLSNETDDDLRNALTKLISVTGDVSGSMKELGTVANVAAERHIDLDSAAQLVGKTMNGNVTPLMKAYGVEVHSVSEGMDLLHTKTDGFAKTATEGMGGALKNLSIQWSEFKESIGLAIVGSDSLAGSTGRLAQALVNLQAWVKSNEGSIGSFIDKLITVAEAIGKVGKFIVEHTPNWYTAGKAVGFFGDSSQKAGDQVKAGNAAVKDATTSLAGSFQATQGQMTSTVLTQTTKRIVLTKEEKAEVERLEKKHAEDMGKFHDETNKAALDLLSAHEKAVQGVVAEANKIMEGMTSAEQTQVKADLKKHLDNMLLSWADFGAGLDTQAAKIKDTEVKQLEVSGGAVTDFDAVLAQHGQHLTDDQSKTLESAAAHEIWRAGVHDMAVEMGDVSNAFANMAQAAGLLPLASMLDGITGISDGLANITKEGATAADVIGGIGAAVSGISGVVKMFTTESASARFIRLALEKNSKRLEESSKAIGDLTSLQTAGGKIAGIQNTLQAFLKDPKGYTHDQQTHALGINQAELTKSLLSHGLGMDDLDALAKDVGIAIRDDKGKIVPKMLQQLLEEIGNLEPTQYANTFQGQKKRIDDAATLFGQDSAGKAKDLTNLASDSILGSPIIAQALAKADFTTAAGRAAVGSIIKDLFIQLPNLKAADLGGLTGSEFKDFLLEINGFLSDLDQGAGPSSSGSGIDLGGASAPPPPAGSGSSDSTPPVDYLSQISTTLIDFATLEQSSFADLLHLETSQLERLTSIDAAINAIAAPTASGGAPAAGESFTMNIDQFIVNSQATDAAGIANDVALQIDRELFRIRQERLRGSGNASLAV